MKIKINILAAVCIFGLILAGVEAPTLLTQIGISALGVAMFAGAGGVAVYVINKEGE